MKDGEVDEQGKKKQGEQEPPIEEAKTEKLDEFRITGHLNIQILLL